MSPRDEQVVDPLAGKAQHAAETRFVSIPRELRTYGRGEFIPQRCLRTRSKRLPTPGRPGRVHRTAGRTNRFCGYFEQRDREFRGKLQPGMQVDRHAHQLRAPRQSVTYYVTLKRGVVVGARWHYLALGAVVLTFGAMKTRIFGHTGRAVGEVGLGTWQIGGNWGDVTEETAMATLRAAVEAGTTFLDTADVYGAGRSETLIGKFLKETRVPLYVATKLGRSSPPGWPGNFTRETIRQHTEASLRRLGVAALDLTQLHCIPPEILERGEVFDHLRELRREGKIRDFGASVESMDEAHLCLRQEGLASLQIIFNLFRQKPIATLFAEAKKKNVALIVRLPLASGLLGGKMTKATTFPADDHRTFNRDGQQFNVGETFAGLPFEKGVELADQLKSLVPSGLTLSELALRWCLDFDAVSVIIPGAKNPAQAAGNARASSQPALSTALHARLAEFYTANVAAHIRGPY
jgi:aryl-alcohol dehydrogenase-like predicted oxidoreductase